MELILLSVANGLIQGGFYSLFAVGLVLIFGVMRVVNFAHGELVMAGAFTIWVVHAQMGLGYIPAIMLAIILVTVVGLVMEWLLFRPTRADPLGGLICSIGVLFILQVCATLVGGDGPSKQVPPPYQGTLVMFEIIRIPCTFSCSAGDALVFPYPDQVWLGASGCRHGPRSGGATRHQHE